MGVVGSKVRHVVGVRVDAKRDHLIDHHIAENSMMALLRLFLGEKTEKQKDIAATNVVLGEMALCGPGLTEGTLPIHEIGIGMAEGVMPIFTFGNRLHQFTKAKVAIGRSGVSGSGDRKADRTPVPDWGRLAARTRIEALSAEDDTHGFDSTVAARCCQSRHIIHIGCALTLRNSYAMELRYSSTDAKLH